MRKLRYPCVYHNVQVASEVVMKFFKMSIILMMAVMVMAGAVQAAPSRIASITDHIDGPTRIAVDAKGNLYVTEAAKGLVAIYSSEGNYLKSFSVSYPVGIAVDPAGNIYVGSGASGKKNGYRNSVSIYTPELVLSGSLGIGEGEFGYPNDIAAGSDGKIYVVDTINHVVKVFDPATGSNFSFGGFGSTSGLFKRPTGIAVSDTAGVAGEIYVVDYPVVSATSGPTDGSRIQVFDKNGQFLRSFGQFGNLIGQITSPVGIAIDSTGLLYVTDSGQNVVHVLNPSDGTPNGAGGLYDPAKPMYIPMGVAISKNGILYAVSFRGEGNKGRIDAFALDGYVTMTVDPLSLTFVGTQYAINPDPQTLVISNTGSGTLNWSATADQAWIMLGKQDPVGPKSAGGLAVGVNTASFAAGSYSGNITIDSGFGQKKTVNVTVNVVPPSVLNISNGWLNFAAKKGTNPAVQGIAIAVDNLTGPVVWSAASDSPWLTISPATGTVSAAVSRTTSTVSVNTTGLPVGSYSGLLTVSAPGAIGTGSKITINLTITSSTRITVNTNRPDARFSVNGPASYTGSGSTWTKEDVPAGDYTVTFDAITGYKKPLPQSKSLTDNGEATFSGNYASWQELAARKNIVVAKGPGIKNDALLKIYKNNAAPVAFDLVALTTRYGANVAVGDIDGDGAAEIVVGAGDGPNNPATVRIYRADKTLVAEFMPFGTMSGARVVAADLDGDGKAEILVSPAGGSDNTGKIAVYAFDTEQKKVIPTGIEFTAYPYAYGANIAVADIDGSGKPVIITAPGFGKQNPALIKVWKVDTTPRIGSWSATWLKDISLSGTYGATVAAGDVDGDGKSEIIAGTSGEQSMVTIIKADGSQTRFKVSDRYGFNLAAADLDGDGNAEIITATGPGRSDQDQADDAKSKSGDKLSKKKDGKEKEAEYGDGDQERGAVRVFSASGTPLYAVSPFEDAKDGINVAVGDLGL
jgi:sugar lactone lactonase YvrE